MAEAMEPSHALCARMDETVPPSEITVEGGKGYSHGTAG
jgi:hypothetical protein